MSSSTWNGTSISLSSGSEFTLAGTGSDFDTPIPIGSIRKWFNSTHHWSICYNPTTPPIPTSSSATFSINAKRYDCCDFWSNYSNNYWNIKNIMACRVLLRHKWCTNFEFGWWKVPLHSRVTPDTSFTPSGSQYVYFVLASFFWIRRKL